MKMLFNSYKKREMKKLVMAFLLVPVVFFFFSVNNVLATNSLAKSERLVDAGFRPNSRYYLRERVDLKGGTAQIPNGVTIIGEGGVFVNGTLVGKDTKIKSKSAVFEKVKIRGSWNISKFSSNLFADLSYDNSLRDILALTNPKVKNTVRINPGNYYLDLSEDNNGIVVPSNTQLIINGTIRVRASSRTHYAIINIVGNNVQISGRGTIIGDYLSHHGTEGEWGHGIYVSGSNVFIQGLNISECWGDCIYVRGSIASVNINKCNLDVGRRHGISVTKANQVKISDVKIVSKNTSVVHCGIDIETNDKDTIRQVSLRNISVSGCTKGVQASVGRSKKSYLNSVILENCIVNNPLNEPFLFCGVKKIMINKCSTTGSKNKAKVVNVSNFKSSKNNNCHFAIQK